MSLNFFVHMLGNLDKYSVKCHPNNLLWCLLCSQIVSNIRYIISALSLSDTGSKHNLSCLCYEARLKKVLSLSLTSFFPPSLCNCHYCKPTFLKEIHWACVHVCTNIQSIQFRSFSHWLGLLIPSMVLNNNNRKYTNNNRQNIQTKR